MVTKAAGGKITGLLALTCEANENLNVKDLVHVEGDYVVGKADGTKPILGSVSVANKGRDRATGAYPVSITPGPCTVEARGWWVGVYTSGAAIAAGDPVGTTNGTTIVTVVAGAVNQIGIALTSAAGAAEAVDVLVQ